MKKHKIDDLFAHKLSGWEPEASPDIWRRIEDRQQKKPRRLGVFWYAAASIAVLLLAGYFGWKTQQSDLNQRSENLAQTEQKQTKAAPSLSPVLPEKSTELAVSTPPSQSSEKVPRVSTARKEERKPEIQPTASSIREQVPILEKMEIAKIDRQIESKEELSKNEEMKESLRSIDVAPATTGAVAQNLPENRVIVARVDVDSDDLETDNSKSSKFIRILRQLKNVKQGEEVDWQEVGFNPKKILARADDQLRNEEAKVSRKYQELKDKTKL